MDGHAAGPLVLPDDDDQGTRGLELHGFFRHGQHGPCLAHEDDAGKTSGTRTRTRTSASLVCGSTRGATRRTVPMSSPPEGRVTTARAPVARLRQGFGARARGAGSVP